MDFILNSRAKKVEIFYENAAEQFAILEFMSKYLTYREDKISNPIYLQNDGISWTAAAAPYTITSNATDLSGAITLNNNAYDIATDITKSLESNIASAIETSIQPKEKKAYAAATLDNGSDEGGYSCLTAYVPRPSKKK